MALCVQVMASIHSGQSHQISPVIACENSEKVIVAPAAAEAFAFDTDLMFRLGLEQVQGDPTEPGEVVGSVANCPNTMWLA